MLLEVRFIMKSGELYAKENPLFCLRVVKTVRDGSRGGILKEKHVQGQKMEPEDGRIRNEDTTI